MATPRPEETLAFLNEYGQKKRRPNPSLKGKNLIAALALGLFVIIILWLIFALVFSGDKTQQNLTGIAAQQRDMYRWTNLATSNARKSETLNTAAVMNAFLVTDNKQLSTYIVDTYKIKDIAKETDPLLNKTVDKKLTNAAQNNRFDEEFKNSVGSGISKYKRDLKSARANAKTAELQKLLDQALSHIEAVTLQ